MYCYIPLRRDQPNADICKPFSIKVVIENEEAKPDAMNVLLDQVDHLSISANLSIRYHPKTTLSNGYYDAISDTMGTKHHFICASFYDKMCMLAGWSFEDFKTKALQANPL